MSATTETKTRPQGRGRLRWVLVRLGYVAASLLVAVAAVELLGRLVLRGVADDARYEARLEELVLRSAPILPSSRLPGKFDAKFGYVLTPSSSFTERRGEDAFPQKTNALGFYTHELGERAPGEYRVLLVGDSFFYGSFLAEEERLGAQLEALAREDGAAQRPLKVYNFAVPGYCGQQELLVARTYAERVGADAIVLGIFAANDAIANALTTIDERGQFAPIPERVERYRSELREALGPWRHSVIARVLTLTQPFGTWLYYRVATRPWVVQANQDLLARFRDFAESEGLFLGVVLQVTKDSLDEGVRGRVYEANTLNDDLDHACAEERLPHVDMRKVFREAGDWRAFIHKPPDSHTNALGTRLTAGAIYEAWLAPILHWPSAQEE